MEATVDTALEDTGDTTASVRLRLSPTIATVATVVATTASVRPMLNPRPLLSLITDTADTEATVEDMEAMVVMDLDTAGATTASVRLRLNPTMAMEDTSEDMVDTVEVTEATEVTVMASSMFPNSSNLAPP